MVWAIPALVVMLLGGVAWIGANDLDPAKPIASSQPPLEIQAVSLVGCHGLHVSAGILWLLTMMAQVYAKGFRADIERRILCFALFWHALDIIWVALFTVVYLMGAAR